MPTFPAFRVAVLMLGALGGLSCRSSAAGPEPTLLWPDGAPGAQGSGDQDRPAIRIYPAKPASNTGAAVVVCPGGGYAMLAVDHEGQQVARWFQSKGVNAYVLRYRHGPNYRHPAPLQDVSRAIRYVRHHAQEWNVDPKRVGVMGFSAGGHLASTVSTHFDAGDAAAADPIDRHSSRPDFSILAYPVISLTASYAHSGSRNNLLGPDPDPALVESLSNERQVTAETPPTFIFHTQEDPGVPVQNALDYYAALVAHKVPAELHVYQHGPHGVGLGIGDPALATWPDRLADWLLGNGFLAAGPRVAVRGRVTHEGTPLSWGTITLQPAEGRRPAASALVHHGEFSIPVERGAAPGRNLAVIKSMGDLAANPSVEDALVLTPEPVPVEVPADGALLEIEVQ